MRYAYKIYLKNQNEGLLDDNIKIDVKELGCGLCSCGARLDFEVGCCEHSNELLGLVEGGHSFDWLMDYQLEGSLHHGAS
jgi:hypothetical protein